MNCKYINYITNNQICMECFIKIIKLIFAIRELRILIDVNTFIQFKVRILSVSLIAKWICIKLCSIYS